MSNERRLACNEEIRAAIEAAMIKHDYIDGHVSDFVIIMAVSHPEKSTQFYMRDSGEEHATAGLAVMMLNAMLASGRAGA